MILLWTEKNLTHLVVVHISQDDGRLFELESDCYGSWIWKDADPSEVGNASNKSQGNEVLLLIQEGTVNALPIPWRFRLDYIFLPISLIPRVWMKIRPQ